MIDWTVVVSIAIAILVIDLLIKPYLRLKFGAKWPV